MSDRLPSHPDLAVQGGQAAFDVVDDGEFAVPALAREGRCLEHGAVVPPLRDTVEGRVQSFVQDPSSLQGGGCQIGRERAVYGGGENTARGEDTADLGQPPLLLDHGKCVITE